MSTPVKEGLGFDGPPNAFHRSTPVLNIKVVFCSHERNQFLKPIWNGLGSWKVMRFFDQNTRFFEISHGCQGAWGILNTVQKEIFRLLGIVQCSMELNAFQDD